MHGYCMQEFDTSVNVKAGVDPKAAEPEKAWVCRTAIDKELACTWQYRKRGRPPLEARKEDELWACYQ